MTTVLEIGKYYYPYKGGFESSLRALVDGLKEKMRLNILVSNTRRRTVIESAANVRIIRLANFGHIFSQPITPTLPFWIKRLPSDIVHLHLPNPLAMISYLAVSPPGRLVVSYHTDIVRQKTAMIFLKPLLMKLLGRAEAVIVTSEKLMDNSDILKSFREKCRIIPHGIDIERFDAAPEILEESKKIKDTVRGPIILFVGRLVYYKGLEYLIRAMKDIDAKLMIVGAGPLGFRLKVLARFLNVSDKILWLGNIPDERLPFYYYACDLFVLPSSTNSESFGLVILEAHACGKSVVSTNLPTGVTFTNLDQKTGLVVSPRDASSLAEAVNRLLASPDLREEYGKNGRNRVRREFTKEIMSESFLKLCGELGRLEPARAPKEI